MTDQIAELGRKRERTAHKDLEDRVSGHVETLKREVDLVRDAPKENVALRRAAASASIFWRHLVFSRLPASLRSSFGAPRAVEGADEARGREERVQAKWRLSHRTSARKRPRIGSSSIAEKNATNEEGVF